MRSPAFLKWIILKLKFDVASMVITIVDIYRTDPISGIYYVKGKYGKDAFPLLLCVKWLKITLIDLPYWINQFK